MAEKNKPFNWKKGMFIVLGIFLYSIIKAFYFDGPSTSNNPQLKRLFNQKATGEMVLVHGHVYKILPDDNQGDRHQKFLFITGGFSLLVAHNIDLAPRVPIEVDSKLSIYGEYVWNEKGGVIHWTHHDPQNRHEGGWIEYKGKKFK